MIDVYIGVISFPQIEQLIKAHIKKILLYYSLLIIN